MGEHVMHRHVKTSDLSRLMKEDEWPVIYDRVSDGDPRVKPIEIIFRWAD